MLLVGTYSQKLGHVDGKGNGVYALRFNRETMSIEPDREFFGKAQLDLVNPTYIVAHRASADAPLFAYVCDEGQLAETPGSLSAVRVDEATGELHKLGASVPATEDGVPDACCHVSVSPGGEHVLAANYLGGSIFATPRLPNGQLDAARTQYVKFPTAAHPITYPKPNAARQEASHAHMVLFSTGSASTTVLVPECAAGGATNITRQPNK